MTKLVSGLSKGQGDGLASLARLALRAPRRRRLAIAVLDCSKITADTETQAEEATMRVIRLEPVAPEDVREVERLYVRAIEAREGRQMLPIDLESQLEAVYGAGYKIDPVTGEIIVPDLEPPLPGDDPEPGDGAPGSQDDTAAAGADGGEG